MMTWGVEDIVRKYALKSGLKKLNPHILRRPFISNLIEQRPLHNGGMNRGQLRMQCPECGCTHIRKNGKKQGKQNQICVACGRQFIESYESPEGYSDKVKRECLKMYVNGMGFWGIERVKGVHHTMVITWVKRVVKLLPDAYEPGTVPLVGEVDELETFVRSKKTKSGCGRWLTTSSKAF